MTDPTLKTTLAERLTLVDNRIREACRQAGRSRDEVTLVAVTKYTTPSVIAALIELGVRDLGENRPQAIWERAAQFPEARWHLIGHLQRNKVERTLPLVHMIHAVDSLRLLQAIEAEKRPCDVLLEFNISHEPQKQGFQIEDLSAIAELLPRLRFANVRGLMGMAALAENPEASRPAFVELRELRDRLQLAIGPAHRLDHLSMGMSGDFMVAVEEGATLVRVGSTLVEGLA